MWHKAGTIAIFTALEAVRGRLLVLLAVTVVIAFLLAEVAAAAAVTESGAIRIAFLAAFLRAAGVFLIGLFVASSVARELADKGADLVLSLALPRHVYYCGKVMGYGLVALIGAMAFGAVVAFYAPPAQAMLWALSLYCEMLIIAALSLLCMFTFSQVTAALSAVAAFYVLGRVIDAIQLMGHGPLIDPNAWSQKIIAAMVDGLAYLLPELYRYTPSEWLVYGTGNPAALAPILGQTIIYLALLIGAGLFDLYRKNF
ncbi:MAG: hypothetical protein ACT4NU_07065 [Chromatiales bacterium]